MTDETIDRIDHLVATKVLGLQGCDDPACDGCDAEVYAFGRTIVARGRPFQPTRDWAAMGEVAEELRKRNQLYSLAPCGDDAEPWCCKVWCDGNRHFVYAATMPLAVALASLKAVGVDVREFEEASP